MKIKKKLVHPMLGGIINYDLQDSLNSIIPTIDKVVQEYIERYCKETGVKEADGEIDLSEINYEDLTIDAKKAIRNLFK